MIAQLVTTTYFRRRFKSSDQHLASKAGVTGDDFDCMLAAFAQIHVIVAHLVRVGGGRQGQCESAAGSFETLFGNFEERSVGFVGLGIGLEDTNPCARQELVAFAGM